MEFIAVYWWLWLLAIVASFGLRFLAFIGGFTLTFTSEHYSVGAFLVTQVLAWALNITFICLFVLSVILNVVKYANGVS
jgi:hypothetical protein